MSVAEKVVKASEKMKALGGVFGQLPEELEWAAQFIEARAPLNVVVEIGVRYGGSLYFFSQFLAPTGLIIGIDPYELPNAAPHVLTVLKESKPLADRVIEQLRGQGQEVHLVNERSENALPAVQKLLNGRQVDLLHIDGNHEYAAARKDFEMYEPLVKSGGLIQMHDIGCKPPHAKTHSSEYWNELKAQYGEAAHSFTQLLAYGQRRGTGVIVKGTSSAR